MKKTLEVRIEVEGSACTSGNPNDFEMTDEIQDRIFDGLRLGITNHFLINSDGVHAVCDDILVKIHK